MAWFSQVEWAEIFQFETPVLEIFVRGSVMYIMLFLLLRLVLKRQAGAVGITDLLVIVLIADASQNAMTDDYKTLPDGILLVSTLIFWNYLLEWLGYHFPWFDKLISPSPLLLIKNGRMIRHNMRKELITENDLLSQLRQQGFDDISQVYKACLEGDGKISIIPNENTEHAHKPPERAV